MWLSLLCQALVFRVWGFRCSGGRWALVSVLSLMAYALQFKVQVLGLSRPGGDFG